MMKTMLANRSTSLFHTMVVSLTAFSAVLVVPAAGQVPDHPVITEIFNNPSGLNDGPTGHDPTNLDQEFIELYIPTSAELDPLLNKDALRLTFYEIEGDSGSTNLGFVNQRYDLPTLDLDPINGLTMGALARPSSGVVVLGWVDYNTFNPPTALAGTPSTRVGLIQGGITVSPAGVMFVAINGAQFGGTTNFPVPTAESRIDIPNENASGVMKNGSNAYLLVNRDDLGYVSLDDHTTGFNDFPGLPGGTILGVSSLLDGIAGNDDKDFLESAQPYVTPTGLTIDLEDVLPAGGVFSLLVPQIDEATGAGYARRFVDVLRTTEDATVGNEDPAFDAINHYRNIFKTGPFFATPGSVIFTTSPPELGVPLSNRLSFSVLANTTARPALLCANIGGDFPIDITVTPGASGNPAIVTFATDAPALAVPGQTSGLPRAAITVVPAAPNGTIVSAPVTFSATNSVVGDPAVVNPILGSTTVVTVLNPVRALDQLGAPIETTVFAAVQGFGVDPFTPNEFLASDLGSFIVTHPSAVGGGSLGNLPILTNPATDLESFVVVDPLRQSFPTSELTFINVPGALGTDDLVTTVLTSAKVLGGSTAYSASISSTSSSVKAIDIPIPETLTKGGMFSPSELLFFADAVGAVNTTERSGLNSVTTDRTFELALIDTNVTSTGVESGDSDDCGLIVQVGQVLPGAAVVTGQFVFLSYMGGLEGEDIDTVDVPGINATVAILLDLDNLNEVLGIKTITRLFVLDADVGGTLNVMEAISLHRAGCSVNADCDDGFFCNGVETCDLVLGCQAGIAPCDDGVACTVDVCDDTLDSCTSTPDNARCDDGLFCNGTEVCDQVQDCLAGTNPCAPAQVCDESGDQCVNESCDPPRVTPIGPRYLEITPAPGALNVALQITGAEPVVSCVSTWVSGSGTVGSTPLWQPPSGPGGWNTISVRGAVLVSGRTYTIRADCDPANPGTVLSASTVATLWDLGDVNNDNVVDIVDIVRVLDGFRNVLDSLTPCTTDADCAAMMPNFTCNLSTGMCVRIRRENVDLTAGFGCSPDSVIDISDIVATLNAFQHLPDKCGTPCP